MKKKIEFDDTEIEMIKIILREQSRALFRSKRVLINKQGEEAYNLYDKKLNKLLSKL